MSPDARTGKPDTAGTRGGADPGGGNGRPAPADRPAGGSDPALSRPGTERPEIAVVSLPGRMPYRETLELQRELARARIDGRLDRDLLLLLEHEPVLTLGRGTEEGHLRAGRARLEEAGVETVEIERGGDVTYHGPGQLVGYPVLDLAGYRKDLHWYLRAVEEALIRALGELGQPAFRVRDHTGVWVGEPEGTDAAAPCAGPADERSPTEEDDASADRGAPPAERSGTAGDATASAVLEGRWRKIASIGVHVSRWVTWHGFALNVTEEPMENFRLIVPCGIDGVHMTSLRGEGIEAGRARVRRAVAAGFASVFDARTVNRDRVPSVAGGTDRSSAGDRDRAGSGEDTPAGSGGAPEGEPPGRGKAPRP